MGGSGAFRLRSSGGRCHRLGRCALGRGRVGRGSCRRGALFLFAGLQRGRASLEAKTVRLADHGIAADAAKLVGNLSRKIDARVVYDWSGGLIWIETPPLTDAGAVDISDRLDASEPLQFGRHRIGDFHAKQRWLSGPAVIAFSSNIGPARMAQALGTQRQHAHDEQRERRASRERAHADPNVLREVSDHRAPPYRRAAAALEPLEVPVDFGPLLVGQRSGRRRVGTATTAKPTARGRAPCSRAAVRCIRTGTRSPYSAVAAPAATDSSVGSQVASRSSGGLPSATFAFRVGLRGNGIQGVGHCVSRVCQSLGQSEFHSPDFARWREESLG